MATHKYSDDRRLSIIQAFVTLMRQKTYESIGTREIAEQAGLTTTAIYYYFGSKDDILLAYLEDYTQRAIDQLLNTVSMLPYEESQSMSVARFTEILMECWISNTRLQDDCLIDTNLMALALRHGELGERYRAIVAKYEAILVEAMQRCGVASPDLEASAKNINIVIMGFIVNYALFGEELKANMLLKRYRQDFSPVF